MWYSSKPGRALAGLLGGLALAAGLLACSTSPTNIGVGLPSVDANSGVYLLDTLTVRASTVLRDSVVTSASSYLLVGRTLDPDLGTLTATSFYTPQLTGPFTPQSNYMLDSVALRLATDNGNYRYGDTTRLQSLVRVYAMTQPLPATGPLFANPAYTPLSNGTYYDATQLLNKRNSNGVPVVPQRRAVPNQVFIRLQLDPAAIGNRLMAAGKEGRLRTQEQLAEVLPGLVIAPGSNDNGALVRLLATSSDAGLILYYHDPANASNVLSYTFNQSGGRHAFQVTADRTTAGIRGLPTQPLQQVDASATSQQTVVEGAIGLQTRLEFPYLNNVRELGRNLNITSAELSLSVPPGTLRRYVPTPPTLVVSTSNIIRQPIGVYVPSVSYVPGVSPVTTLDQGTYIFSMTSYVQAVLNGSVPNNGFLVGSATPELPTRVILGGPRHPTNRLQLRLYVINTAN